MSSMENPQRVRRVRNPHSLVQAATGVIGVMEWVLNPVERVGSFHSHKTLATDVGKADTKRYRTANLWMQCVEAVERKDTLRRLVSRGNVPHTHWRFHKLPPALQRQGLVNPSTLMMEDSQYTHIWSVSPCEQTFNQVPHCIGLFDT